MKLSSFIFIMTAFLLLCGCGNEELKSAEKKANPTFMFWCFRKEIVSAEYHIPEMKTPAAAAYLQGRLKAVPGYENSSYDLSTQTMIISYRSSTVRKMNFEEAIALSGFSVNKRPANPSAKLPEGVK